MTHDKLKPVNPSVVDYLAQVEESFELLKLDNQEAIKASEWLENNFPIASWGRIAWDKVPKSSCITWTDFSELLSAFQKLVTENKLEGSVIVLWTNASTLPLKINMDVLVKYAEPIFEEDWDTWVCSEENKWCIEVYHEGEICFGYTCRGAI
jgi:hypothetical protein